MKPRIHRTFTKTELRSLIFVTLFSVISYASAQTDPLTVLPNGNVGFGISNPLFPIDMLASQSVIRMVTFNNGFGSVLDLKSTVASPTFLGAINFSDNSGVKGQIAYKASDEFGFTINGSEPLRIYGNGIITPSVICDIVAADEDMTMILNNGGLTANAKFNVVSDLQIVLHVDANGDGGVLGNFSKGGGSFKIDHPLDPENKYLYHSFVESPDMMNVYNGNALLNADGEVTIEMEDWFEELNRDFRYQLTPIGAPGPNLYIAEEMSDRTFRIAGGTPGMKVSWQVTGIRQDPFANEHRIPVEVKKEAYNKGKYVHPRAWEKSKGVVGLQSVTIDEKEISQIPQKSRLQSN